MVFSTLLLKAAKKEMVVTWGRAHTIYFLVSSTYAVGQCARRAVQPRRDACELRGASDMQLYNQGIPAPETVSGNVGSCVKWSWTWLWPENTLLCCKEDTEWVVLFGWFWLGFFLTQFQIYFLSFYANSFIRFAFSGQRRRQIVIIFLSLSFAC